MCSVQFVFCTPFIPVQVFLSSQLSVTSHLLLSLLSLNAFSLEYIRLFILTSLLNGGTCIIFIHSVLHVQNLEQSLKRDGGVCNWCLLVHIETLPCASVFLG